MDGGRARKLVLGSGDWRAPSEQVRDRVHGQMMRVFKYVHESRVLPPGKTLTTPEEREILHDLSELGDDHLHRRPFVGLVLDHARDQGLHERKVRVLLHYKNCA